MNGMRGKKDRKDKKDKKDKKIKKTRKRRSPLPPPDKEVLCRGYGAVRLMCCAVFCVMRFFVHKINVGILKRCLTRTAFHLGRRFTD